MPEHHNTDPSAEQLAGFGTLPMSLTFVRSAVSARCGGSEGWFEQQGTPAQAVEISRGCTCHQHPASLDLEDGTLLPSQVWMVVGQRGLTIVAESYHEALHEMADLDDKYRPAYLAKGQISKIEIIGVRPYSGDED